MYQEDQQILRMSTYRFPEILIRLVSAQQDVLQAEKGELLHHGRRAGIEKTTQI